MIDTIVVIPCYNEAQRLDVSTFLTFIDQSNDVRLLFVNDGSTDATAEILAQLRENSHGRAWVRSLPTNMGKAEAVRQGLLEALDHGPKHIGFWDADLATPLDEIATLANILRQRPHLQLVMGSRVALLGRFIQRSYKRHLCGRLFATAASMALGLPVYDTQCGAKLLRASPRMQALLQQPFLSRWIFDVEILARLAVVFKTDNIVYEQPLQRWQDVAGSKLRLHHFALAARELLTIWKTYRLRGAYQIDEEALRERQPDTTKRTAA